MSRPALVSIKWLAEQLASSCKNIRIIDASWHLPNTGRNAHAEYEDGHIPNSLFFDINGCADTSTDMAHMLPSPDVFEEYVGNLGINNNTHVILYDNNDKFGVFSAPRVWWTFRIFGHNAVSILEGGFPSWIKNGLEVSVAKTPAVPREVFKSAFKPNLVTSIEQIEENIEKKNFQLVDARPNGRFEGISPEPRADIKPGHIINSCNLPFTKIVDEKTRKVLDVQQLKKLFKDSYADLDKPIVTTCGSGISACNVAFAAYLCGKEDVSVYDGSWTEFFRKGKPEQKVNVP